MGKNKLSDFINHMEYLGYEFEEYPDEKNTMLGGNGRFGPIWVRNGGGPTIIRTVICPLFFRPLAMPSFSLTACTPRFPRMGGAPCYRSAASIRRAPRGGTGRVKQYQPYMYLCTMYTQST